MLISEHNIKTLGISIAYLAVIHGAGGKLVNAKPQEQIAGTL
jgi:hypothetical protein